MQQVLATAMEEDLEEAGEELFSIVAETLRSKLINKSIGMALGAISSPRFPALKDHAARHSDLKPADYYKDALRNMSTGTKFKVKHDGQIKSAYVTRLGDDKFQFTSASKNGKTVFTHMEVDSQYFRNKGITLPKGFDEQAPSNRDRRNVEEIGRPLFQGQEGGGYCGLCRNRKSLTRVR